MTASQSIAVFYEKGIDSLINELEGYPNNEVLWKSLPGTTNSGGTLFLHLMGNLRHFVIKGLANTDYIRNREAEFANRDISKQDILSNLLTLKDELKHAFSLLKDHQLTQNYPIPFVGGKIHNTQFMLNQMIVHLNYHMGQINYHRRFFSNK